jgi:hypothetical protein
MIFHLEAHRFAVTSHFRLGLAARLAFRGRSPIKLFQPDGGAEPPPRSQLGRQSRNHAGTLLLRQSQVLDKPSVGPPLCYALV